MRWEPTTVVKGLGFPEGPVVLDDGSLAFTDIKERSIMRWAGEASTVARTGGGPNGATLAGDGSLLVANNGGLNLGPHGYWFADDFGDGNIQRVTLDGSCTTAVADLPGRAPHRPNDLCFGPDGWLYFTDPANWEDFANLMPGRIVRTDLAGTVEILAEIPSFPNGIGFGADGRLYVAQTVAMKVVAFDWSPDGLGQPRDFAALPTGFPDGFCFTAEGDLIVCGAMGHVIHVFDADGGLKQTMETGDETEPTNCCIGDGVLYVTLSGIGEVVSIDIEAGALPLHRGGPR